MLSYEFLHNIISDISIYYDSRNIQKLYTPHCLLFTNVIVCISPNHFSPYALIFIPVYFSRRSTKSKSSFFISHVSDFFLFTYKTSSNRKKYGTRFGLVVSMKKNRQETLWLLFASTSSILCLSLVISATTSFLVMSS